MTTRRSGYVIALEGPESLVSSQFSLIPDDPSVLKIRRRSRRKNLGERDPRLARRLRPANINRSIYGVDCCIQSHLEKAEAFIAAGSPGEVRIVFLEGGAVGATRACTDANKRHPSSVLGDVTHAEVPVANMVGGGADGHDMGRQSWDTSRDPSTEAMRAAEELDQRTASLQPEPAYEYLPYLSAADDNAAETQVIVTLDHSHLTPPQPKSHFSSWDTLSDGHSSGHISTAHEVSFQHARLVPVLTCSPECLSYKEDGTPDFCLCSEGRPRPPTPVRNAKHQEALMFLEGEIQPDHSCDPLPDLVFLLQEDSAPIHLEKVAAAYRTEEPHIDDGYQPASDIEDRILELRTSNYANAVGLQNDIRAELRRWLTERDPALNLSILAQMLERNTLSVATQAALASLDERIDLIVAVASKEGLSKRFYEAVLSRLVRLGKPDGKTYSRAGRIEFKRLLTELMVAHTSQPLLQQTDNPFENDSTTAEATLPHIASYLSSHPQKRFLIINFADRHLPVVLALRTIIGRKKFKIAAITLQEGIGEGRRWEASQPASSDGHALSYVQPSPLTQNPPNRRSFSEADWLSVLDASSNPSTEALNMTTRVWRALREADDWYTPGGEAEEPNYGDDNRVSIAVTTESPSTAPKVARPASTAKRPEGYELGKSNFSRPLLPVSPPDSIPASLDRAAPPPPEVPPRSSSMSAGSDVPPPLPPRPLHSPHGPRGYIAPASPEPTIGSSASGSSGSTWKKTLAKKFKKRSGSGTPSIDGEGSSLRKKLSALFGPAAVENAVRGKHISPPHLESTTATRAMQTLKPLPFLPPLPCHSPIMGSASDDAPATGLDDGDDGGHDDGMDGEDEDVDEDEEERRVLGHFASVRRRDEADKARRMLGLP